MKNLRTMNKNLFFKIFLLSGDAILMYTALFLALAGRYGDFTFSPGPQSGEFLLHFSVIHIFWLMFLYAFDFYELSQLRGAKTLIKNGALFAIFAFAFGAVYFYLNTHSLISPKTILFVDVVLFSTFLFCRVWATQKIFAGKRFEHRVAVAGWSPEMEKLVRDYLPKANFRVVAVYQKNFLPGFEKARIFNRWENFLRAIEEMNIEVLVIAALPRDRDQFSRLVDMANERLKIRIISQDKFCEEIAGKIPLSAIDPLWVAEFLPRNDSQSYVIAKRLFDVLFSLAMVVVAAIIFLPTALAIKIDSPGPVLYVQRRKGKNGKIFNFYKFRTMTADKNQYLIFRANDESQITRVGKILRATHFDEFPQFFNILRGELSVVGPRPEWDRLAVEFEQKIPFYRYRYLVKPGFTGWAQINYKASSCAEEAAEKYEYDLYYIKNRSFWMDIAIIAKTMQLFFR